MNEMPRNSVSTRSSNRTRILQGIRREGVVPRVSLSRSTGLSPAAVSEITSELLAEGMLREGSSSVSQGPGRPSVFLSLNPSFGRVVGTSLRLNLLDVLVTDFVGQPLHRQRFDVETRALSAEELVAFYAASITQTLAALDDDLPTLCVGLGLQGMVDAQSGMQIWSPILSCTYADLRGPLQEALGASVVLANDAVAFALAIAERNTALQTGTTAVLMVGHGVAMTILRDGVPLIGDGGAASEIGHVKRTHAGPQCRCGQRGCIEASLAEYAVYRDACTVHNLPVPANENPSPGHMRQLVDLARDGDEAIAALFSEAGAALADAVATTVSIADPHAVALTGTMIENFDLMQDGFDRRLAQALMPWRRERIRILVRPADHTMIEDGMARRALAELDHALPRQENSRPRAGTGS